MWASANLVADIGCEAMELDCEATDVEYVLDSGYDGNWNLANFKECLREKCEKREDGGYRNKQPWESNKYLILYLWYIQLK